MARPNGPSLLSISFDSFISLHVADSTRVRIYQSFTFVITFGAYLLYHANRKVVGIVKQVWNENCTQAHPEHNDTNPHWCDWPPFDGDNADSLFGYMDVAFLFAYAIAMFFSGYLAERSNLRRYLSVGMFLAGFFNLAVGAGYWINIHFFSYYVTANILSGAFQATGWPSVVTLMGNWFGRNRRGAIMGLWNIHTSVGNMLGSFIAGIFVDKDWGLSFAVPSIIMMYYAIIVYFFVVPHPKDFDIEDPNKAVDSASIRRRPNTCDRAHASSEERSCLLDYQDAPYETVGEGDFSEARRSSMSNSQASLDAVVNSRHKEPTDSTRGGILECSGSLSYRRSGSALPDVEDSLSQGPHNSYQSTTNGGAPLGVENHDTVLNYHAASISDFSSSHQITADDEAKPVTFCRAVQLPGVFTYATALFFIKFVNYVFLFWLPKYIHTSTTFSASQSANMSMCFDLGGIAGGITAGVLSDRFRKPANTCFWMLVASIPMLYAYYWFGSSSVGMSAALLVITGFFVNAPYALITTAVSAELGQHESLQGNAQALATVSAFIDGGGSIGAALGPMFTGLVAGHFGWESVFNMLMISSAIALVCLFRLVLNELKRSCSCLPARCQSGNPV